MNPYTARAMIKNPAKFVGRTAELESVYTLLFAMQSCSIVGPRRIGKSSLLYHLCEPQIYQRYLSNAASYVFAFVDLQELAGLYPDEFFFTVIRRLNRAGGEKLQLDLENDGTFAGFRRFLMRNLETGLKLVLCCDEFEMLSQNERFGADFFTYLRGLSSNYNLALVTSSREGLFKLCHVGNLQTSQFWNIFVEHHLGTMSAEEAHELILNPLDDAAVVFTEHDVEFVLSLAGTHPFYIQLACYYLYEAKASGTTWNYTAVRQSFIEEADRYYTFTWRRLSDQEKRFLIGLVKGETGTLSDRLVRRLQHKALLKSSSHNPALISEGWHAFIEYAPMENDKTVGFNQTSSQRVSLAAFRRRLSNLDDPEIDALCLDYFPSVYDKFARGLRRDEKFNYLLDYCRRDHRRLELLDKLLNNLQC
jgi:hypothetical protein